MSWVKIDDGAYQHEKLLDVGAKAAWLWVCGLSYCNGQERRDGFIPRAVVKLLYPGVGLKDAERLVERGLWERTDRGFLIHDYHDYQPTEAQAAQLSADRAAAGRLGGQRSAEAKAKQRAQALASQANKQTSSKPQASTSSPSRSDPVPSRPLPTRPSDSAPPVASEPNPEPEPDPGRETLCPNDLDAKAETLGVLAKLAENMAVPIESIRHEAKDFREFYTFGGGAGERRTGWMRQLRERIRKRHREGQLKPLGAIQHDAQRGRTGHAEAPCGPSPMLAEALEAIRTPLGGGVQ